MAEHLDTERISGLLDAPWSDKGGQAHLEACADCQAEYERLSRIRMALSALPDEDPPMGQWAAIEAALDGNDVGRDAVVTISRRVLRRFLLPGPLQAAAGLVLFAGGLMAGIQLTSGESVDGTVDPPLVVSSGDDRALLDGMTRMESLTSQLRQAGIGSAGPEAGGPRTTVQRDPVQLAQSLSRLEGSIRLLRELLDADPDDVAAGAYLLELVEMREQLTEELGRARGTTTW